MNKVETHQNATLLFVGVVLFVLGGYVMNIWLGRYLGPEIYGSYVVVISIMTAINLVQTAGLPQAVSRLIAEHGAETHSILVNGFLLQILITSLLSGLLFSLAPALALALNDQGLTPYLRMAAGILPPYGLYAYFAAYHNGLHNFNRQGLMNALYAILKVALVIILTLKLGLFGAILGFAIAPIGPSVLGFAQVKGKINRSIINKIFRPTLPLTAYAVISTLHVTVALYFVKALGDHAQTGIYGAEQNITSLIFFATNALVQMVLPIASRANSKGDILELRTQVSDYYRYALIIAAPLTSVIAFLAPSLLLLLYGSKYLTTDLSLQILAVAMCLASVASVLGSALVGMRAIKPVVTGSASSLAILCLFSFFFVGHYQLVGAALATLIASCTLLASFIYTLKKRIGFIPPQRATGIVTGAAFLVGVAIGVSSGLWLVTAPLLILGIVTYIAILATSKVLTLADLVGLFPGRMTQKLSKGQ